MKPPRTRSDTPPAEPPLQDGERLSQAEFHRRYQDYPEDVKFELIGGVVHMASPMRMDHGLYTTQLNGALYLYKVSTPGTLVAENITTILASDSEPQPDLLLCLLRECGGLAERNTAGYLTGPPEFVAEVAHSTVAIDLHSKKDDYLAAGVQEYLVVCVEEQELHWFHFPSKTKLKPDRKGLWKSQIFPGLWIDGTGLLALDSARVVAGVQQGLASAGHRAFVRRLQSRRGT